MLTSVMKISYAISIANAFSYTAYMCRAFSPGGGEKRKTKKNVIKNGHEASVIKSTFRKFSKEVGGGGGQKIQSGGILPPFCAHV